MISHLKATKTYLSKNVLHIYDIECEGNKAYYYYDYDFDYDRSEAIVKYKCKNYYFNAPFCKFSNFMNVIVEINDNTARCSICITGKIVRTFEEIVGIKMAVVITKEAYMKAFKDFYILWSKYLDEEVLNIKEADAIFEEALNIYNTEYSSDFDCSAAYEAIRDKFVPIVHKYCTIVDQNYTVADEVYIATQKQLKAYYDATSAIEEVVYKECLKDFFYCECAMYMLARSKSVTLSIAEELVRTAANDGLKTYYDGVQRELSFHRRFPFAAVLNSIKNEEPLTPMMRVLQCKDMAFEIGSFL